MGSLLLCFSLDSRRIINREEWPLVVGIGYFIGCVVVSVLVYALSFTALYAHAAMILVLTQVTVILTLVAIMQRKKNQILVKMHQRLSNPKKKCNYKFLTNWPTICHLIVGLWLMTCVSFVAFEVVMRPATSWDSVSYWLPAVAHQIDPALRNEVHRHPPLLKFITVYSWMAADLSNCSSLQLISWLLAYLSIIALIISFAYISTKRKLFSLCCGLITSALPMLESLTSLAGYAEIWLALGILAAHMGFHLLAPEGEKANPKSWIFLILSLAAISALKSGGAVYALIIFAAAVLGATTSSESRKKSFLLFLLFPTALFGITALTGHQTKILGHRFFYDSLTKTLHLNHYSASISTENMAVSLNNLSYALIINASYSFLFLFWLIGIAIYLVQAYRRRPELSFRVGFPLFSSIGLYFLLFFAQVTSEYFLKHSVSVNDTSLSRASVSWALLTILLFCAVFRKRI